LALVDCGGDELISLAWLVLPLQSPVAKVEAKCHFNVNWRLHMVWAELID
jgi:hypothetical protein